jgi:hypothetical protein
MIHRHTGQTLSPERLARFCFMGYQGFKKVEASVARSGTVRDPGAVAASIGRKKYGAKKFQKAAAQGKKMRGMARARS